MATPPLLCLLAICAGSLVLLVPINDTSATRTPDLAQTQLAGETAQHQNRVEQAAGSATAVHASQQAADRLTATAVAAGRLGSLTQQALTQAALPTITVRPSATATFDPDNLPPTRTPTPPAIVTLTLLECRGYDGTVSFDRGAGQSLHAFSSLSFTGPRGVHTLQIFWLNHADQNVDTTLDLQRDTTLVYGDQC